MGASWRFSLLLAAFVLELEFRAEQRTGIVGNAPQPRLVGEALLALRRRFDGRRLFRLRCVLRTCQRLLHACALRGIGLALRLGIGRLRLRALLRVALRALLLRRTLS
jgi:hypothetical protein